MANEYLKLNGGEKRLKRLLFALPNLPFLFNPNLLQCPSS